MFEVQVALLGKRFKVSDIDVHFLEAVRCRCFGHAGHPVVQNLHNFALVADGVSSIFQEGIRKRPEAHSEVTRFVE